MNGKGSRRFLGAALLAAALLCAGCGGGGGGGTILIVITSVNPAQSTDLTGGDRVQVTGRNFTVFTVISVTFAGAPGTNMQVLDDTTIEVTTPPAPNGQAGFVGVEINWTDADGVPMMSQLPAGYRYQGAGGGAPNPQTINPTTYTPTGAQPFTIQGTSLGIGGGIVNVVFNGIGTVTGQVSQDATIVTGVAPISAGVPPAGLVTVTVDTGTDQANVPTQVQYPFSNPQVIPLPNQGVDGASRPVRLGNNAAVACSSVNGIWGDADDEVLIIQGPKTNVQALFVRRGNGSPVGFLDGQNSIPAVLDENTFCLFSPGAIVLITDALTSPVVTISPIATGINPAPLAAIASNRIAFTAPGPVGGTNVVTIIEFTGTVGAGVSSGPIGGVDPTPGRANLSIPYSTDGENVFVYTSGSDAVFGDNTDLLNRFTFTSGSHIQTAANFLAGPPTALSADLLAAPDGGLDQILGNATDRLAVYDATTGAFATTFHNLPSVVNVGAAVLAPRIGAGGVALPVVGGDGQANTNDDEVCIFTDPLAGTFAALLFARTPLFVPLGNGDLHVFGLGNDGAAASGDERVARVLGDATASTNHQTFQIWNQGFVPLADQTRTFAIGAGADGNYGTGDETLLVYQSASLGTGAIVDAVSLPLALPGARALGTLPFVPIGPDWGLVQTPGPGVAIGGPNDGLLIACY